MTTATEHTKEDKKSEAKQEKAPPKGKAETKDKEAPLEGRMAEFLDWIEGISVRELSLLVKALEERLGVSAAAPVAAVAAAGAVQGGGAGTSAAAEEKTEFSVVLTNVGAQKIGVIKEVRTITGLGLKESKDLVESAPKTVKEGVSKDEANSIKSKLEAAGATVEIK